MANSELKSLVQSQFAANAEHYATSHIHAEGESLKRLVELTKPRACRLEHNHADD